MAETLIQLHGFGGSPADFTACNQQLLKHFPQLQICIPDLYVGDGFHPDQNLETWIRDFSLWLKSRCSQPVWLMGYSMGGRLAMNAIAKDVVPVRGAIFLSASPGVISEAEKSQRRIQEELWCERFLQMDVTTVNRLWNEQAVFSGSKPKTLRDDIPMSLLAKNLKNWSPTNHLFEVSSLKQWSLPCLWLAGEKDKKYAQCYSEMQRNGYPGHFLTIDNEGHRLLETQGTGITAAITEFFKNQRVEAQL